jgi:DNA-directed RNA polymerase subunit F
MLMAMSAFDEITVKTSDPAAGEAPVTTETPSSETPVAPVVEAQPEQPKVEVETPTDPNALPEQAKSGQPTEDETQFVLTGHETPDQIQQRGGDSWLVKAGRKSLAVAKEAGGFQNLRLGAGLIAAVQNPEITGRALMNEIAKVSESRAQEIVNDIYWSNVRDPELADATIRGLFKMPDLTFAEAEKAIRESRELNTLDDEPQDELTGLTPALRKEIEDLRSIKTQIPELQREVTGFKTSREQEEVQQLGGELYKSVFSVVEERKKKLGLDILPTDSDEVKFIKQSLGDHLSSEAIERQFEANEENARLSDRAITFIKKRDRNGAFAYKDQLTMAAELTFEQMLKDPRIAHEFTRLKSVMEAQSKPKDPTARQEIVAGALAATIPEDAFEKGRQEGLSPFDVSEQLAKQRAAAR